MDRNIFSLPLVLIFLKVALRKESVDRNGMEINGVSYDVVALRKESVDRNTLSAVRYLRKGFVALRKESVDRN